MLAIADHLLDGTPAPYDLSYALRVSRWGSPEGNGWLDWPAGQMTRVNGCLNVYNAGSGYQRAAGSTAEWAKRNPQGWELVGVLLEARMRRYANSQQ